MTEFTARDDDFHFAEMGDRWWMTETSWFAFCNPDQKLGGWLYTMARPNIGTVAGGAWVWDGSAHLPWEVLYNANYTALRLPRDQDLSDITLPTGVSIKAVEPTMGYELGIDGGAVCQAKLRFQGVMAPRPLRRGGSPFGASHHFDQFGRVTGRVTLGQRVVEIDCFGMRDRSWGPRPEHRPKRSAYVTGMATPQDGFLAVTRWHDGIEENAYGFIIRDGAAADLVSGRRHVERDPAQGWVTRIIIEGQDEQGRTLHAIGTRLSGIINRHSFIDPNGQIEWEINGHKGHGEDQAMWPVHDWAAMRGHGWRHEHHRLPRPSPVKAGPALWDFFAGTHLYSAIFTALFEQEKTGVGRQVEVAMLDAVYPSLASSLGLYHGTRDSEAPVPSRTGNRHGGLAEAPYNVYPTRDGFIAIICVGDVHWRSLLDAMGRADLTADPRFGSLKERVADVDEIDRVVGAWTAGHGKQALFGLLQRHRVPCAPVRELAEVVNDPHMHERGALQWQHHPELGRIVVQHSAMRFLGSALRPLDPSHRLGADADRVLADHAGRTTDQVAALRDAKVVS